MSKDKKNAQKTPTAANVENTVENTVENEQTPEQLKAAQVLRAKLPALSERNFNFEKRTGNCFTASIVTVYDEEGNEVLENGEVKQKLTRKVVEIENEAGELLPEYEDIANDLATKRAAAFVLSFEANVNKLMKKKIELEKEITLISENLDSMDSDLITSIELVMNAELPERAQRVNMTVKLTAANDKLEKMRAMLLAAGMSEEEINEQLNG